jgi:cytosine/uracil/thiamine/allantoin permease
MALLLGAAFLFVLLSLSGFMGTRTGIPFPVMSRISFGTRGAQIPALIRGGVAIAWFGIQTYLASMVLDVMLITLFPGLQSLKEQVWACHCWAGSAFPSCGLCRCSLPAGAWRASESTRPLPDL